jgi:CheY-like chemotaxis protein
MKDFSILLIDDEPAQITSIKSFLMRRHFKVLTAGSGDEGLGIINNGNIDLILTDYRMPGLSGLDVVRKVKSINP